MMMQQPDGLNPPVRLDPSPRQKLSDDCDHAKEVDLGVVHREFEEHGPGVVVDPMVAL